MLHGELRAEIVHEAEVEVEKVREGPGLVRVFHVMYMSCRSNVCQTWSGVASCVVAEFKLDLNGEEKYLLFYLYSC